MDVSQLVYDQVLNRCLDAGVRMSIATLYATRLLDDYKKSRTCGLSTLRIIDQTVTEAKKASIR